VSVGVDVVGAQGVAVVADPALVGIIAAAPLHKRSLTRPGVVVVLVDAAKIRVVGGVQGLGVTLGEHDDVSIWKTGDDVVRGKAREYTFDGVAGGFVGEDGIEEVAFDGEMLGLGHGLFRTGRRGLAGACDGAVVTLQVCGKEV
jgi:hypothetical protein